MTPSPACIDLCPLDEVTFTSVREDPEKWRRGAEIRAGRIVVVPEGVYVLEPPPPRPRGKFGRGPATHIYPLAAVRLRTVRRAGTLVAKLPHIEGER